MDLSQSGTATLRQGVAKDRRKSHEDAQMRHGRKSRSVRVDGDIRHVLHDLDSGLVRAVLITPANVAEARVTEAIQADQLKQQVQLAELLRVYDLQAQCVRIDTTTASSDAEVNEQGLLQLGHSKDHRPDLPQLKVVLASLDPLGMPLASEVLSGEHADDPVYLPIIARVRDGLRQNGLLYVGDGKMAALPTRASIQAEARLLPVSPFGGAGGAFSGATGSGSPTSARSPFGASRTHR